MSDPAIEAAKQVWERHEPPYISDDLVAAAREALKPIRQKWEELLAPYATRLVDPEAAAAIKVLEAFAALIFTTEELER